MKRKRKLFSCETAFSFGEHEVRVFARSGEGAGVGDDLSCRGNGDKTGLDIWTPATVQLGEYMAQNPQLTKGKRVLELGAGAGVCGFLAAKMGAQNVTLTDMDDDVLELLRVNASANEVGRRCQISRLKWGDTVDEKPDIVLASECIYLTSQVAPLLKTVKQMLLTTDSDSTADADADGASAADADADGTSTASAGKWVPPCVILSHTLRFSVWMGNEGKPVVSTNDDVLDKFREESQSAGLSWKKLSTSKNASEDEASTEKIELYGICASLQALNALPLVQNTYGA